MSTNHEAGQSITITRNVPNDQQLEAAARYYCQIQNLDPDLCIAHGPAPDANGTAYAVCLYTPRWRLVAAEIRSAWAIQQAIDFVEGKNHSL